MAQIIDERKQEVDEVEDNDAVSQEAAASEPEEEQVSELPAQYRNKTTDELIKMHQEAESRLGKQGEEVGQYRKIIDDFILKQTKSDEPEQAEDIDFFADPDKAVEHKIANHPTLKHLERLGVQMQQSQTLSALQQKHPDLKEIALNTDFQKWVTGSKVPFLAGHIFNCLTLAIDTTATIKYNNFDTGQITNHFHRIDTAGFPARL